MIRFSLRSRSKDGRRTPADRAQKPLGKSSSPIRGPPASFLVNYDTLPARRPDGTALDYHAYEPSPYFKPTTASRTRRRRRAAAQPKRLHPGFDRPTSVAHDLGLDFDSLQRNKRAAVADDILQLVPVEEQIRAKIVQLRALLREGDRLGDIEVLKDLVGIHGAHLSNRKHAAQIARSQIKEAKIIAGIIVKPPVIEAEQRSTLIRKVSGKPSRHISGRTASALRARTASMRSASRHHKTVAEHRSDDNRPPGRDNHPPGPTKGMVEFNKLTRKSSARLKRLGSAGSVLIRRLSKVSVAEDASSGSSAEPPMSSTFDQETMKRLKASPADVIAEYEAELKRIDLTEDAENDKLKEAKERLENRRIIHDKAMAILDQFYGNLPGWGDDPIAVRMLPDTADMTEAGIEAERDLAEVRLTRERVFAAHEDHGRVLTALGSVSSNMSLFVEQLEALVSSIDDCEETSRSGGVLIKISRDVITGILKDLENLMHKCVQNAKVAAECCTEAPRVGQIERDLGKLEEGFTREAEAVMKQGTVYKNDFAPTLQVVKSTLCDCKLAETFVAERRNMISEDLETFDSKVERYEEYVMLERIGILDTYHPTQEGR